MKTMGTYGTIETDQDRINPAKIIPSICHLQYSNNQDIMAAVEKDK